MRKNVLRERLIAGQPTLSTRMVTTSPEIVEIIGLSGQFDFIELCGEYGAWTLPDLGYHIFRLSLAYREAMEQAYLPEGWLQGGAPPEIPDGPAIALYGQNVRVRLADWLGRPEGCRGVVNTYYGHRTAHELLERTTWHAAQHLRQIYIFLERMGVTPDHPLRDEDYKGLPIPKEVWS